jgi:hypothetical protein
MRQSKAALGTDGVTPVTFKPGDRISIPDLGLTGTVLKPTAHTQPWELRIAYDQHDTIGTMRISQLQAHHAELIDVSTNQRILARTKDNHDIYQFGMVCLQLQKHSVAAERVRAQLSRRELWGEDISKLLEDVGDLLEDYDALDEVHQRVMKRLSEDKP